MVIEMKVEGARGVCQGDEVLAEGVLLAERVVLGVGVKVEVLIIIRNEEVKVEVPLKGVKVEVHKHKEVGVEVHKHKGARVEVHKHKGAKAEPSHKAEDQEGITHPDLLLHQIIDDHYHKDGVKVNDINWYPLKQPQQLQHIMMIIQLIHDYQNDQQINQYQHLLLLVVIVGVKVGVKV